MTELRQKDADAVALSLQAAARRIHVDAAVRSSDSTLVVVGIDRTSEEPVVMRLLLPERAVIGSAADRFLRAGEQAARIDSPHVAAVREVGRLDEDGPPYWLVEQASGTSLRELLALNRPVALPIAIEYAIEITRALGAVHACQLVHGRLRPSKVFRIPHADPVRIKVIDVGLAAATAAPTARGLSMPPEEGPLRVEYRSPELVAGSRRFEAASDLWGLGLVLFEMLTGQTPFRSSATRTDFARAVAEGPPPLDRFGLSAPAQLEDLIRELLRKDASQRPGTAAAVEERLVAIASSLGVDMSGGAPRAPGQRSRPIEPPGTLGADVADGSSPEKRTESLEQAEEVTGEPDGRATSAKAPAGTAPARQRFLGPAMGNLGARAGGYSLSGGSVPREEVSARRKARSPHSRRQSAKRPSQAPRKPRLSQPPRGGGGPGVEPQRPARQAQPTMPDASGGRHALLVRTDPATPRALGERQIAALLGGAVRDEVAPVASTPLPLDPTAGHAPATGGGETPSPDAGTAATFELDSDAYAPSGPEEPVGGRPADRISGRPKLRTAPGSWTLDLNSGPGSWEIERTPSTPPVRANADAFDGPTGRSSVPPKLASSPPEDSQATTADCDERSEEPFGPYRIERTVHLGAHTERVVAVATAGPLQGSRILIERGRLGEDVDLERCKQVAEVVGRAGHGNLLGIHEAGVIDRTPYIACEYVDGTDLRSLTRSAVAHSQPISPQMAAYLVRRIGAGLDAYHRAIAQSRELPQSVHGDVRPSNVMLSATGEVKLGPPALTQGRGGAGRGKFDFISPEELTGEPLHFASDLFALGAMLGELLIAGPIFPGRGLDVLLAIARGEIEPLRRQAQKLPAELLAVCERALARHPADRHGSASELADALEPFDSDAAQCAQSLGALVQQAGAEAVDPRRLGNVSEPERTAISSLAEQTAAARQAEIDSSPHLVRVRRAHSGLIGQLPHSGLLEAVATGNLGPDDEVTWDDSPFKPLREVPTLADRLLLSAPALKGNLIERRAADHVYQSREIPMLEVLTQMRLCHANALVLIENLSSESNRRTEVYLREGRVVGARSSDPSELLGERLVRLGAVDRSSLSDGFRAMAAYENKLGNALVGLGLIDAVELFRLIREQVCSRIAQVFSWHEARTRVYLGQGPPPSPFGLAMDLTEPMMAGVLVASEQEPATMLPGMLAQIEPGPRAPGTEGRELNDLPAVLRATAAIVGSRPVVAQAIRALEARTGASGRDACAALVVAQAMRWISVRAPGS